MIDSTNPRVMADNIRQLAASGSRGSTVVPNPEGQATANLEKLGIDGSVYGIPVYNPVDYSTDEADLGIKWIDGGEVYRKTFNLAEALAVSRENFTDADSVIKIPDAVTFLNVFSVSSNNNYQGILLCERAESGHIQLLAIRNGTGTVNCKIITFTYTKAPVVANSTRKTTKK